MSGSGGAEFEGLWGVVEERAGSGGGRDESMRGHFGPPRRAQWR